MKDIKMVDLNKQYSRIKKEIDDAIRQVLDSTAFIQGPQVASFAAALGKYVNVAYVIPCANGTDALQIAMMALDLKPGDEVILPVHTYVATAEVIALLRLKPVFAEVNEDSFNIDVSQLEKLVTPATRAIVPVHLYGQCADMEAILSFAKKHSLYVIEDAAQALGATCSFTTGATKYAGTMGDVGTTSFFPSKNLGCFGDGGAIFISDAALASKIRMIANHGQQKKYHHDLIGVNSRLDTLQAAILEVKLRCLDEYTAKRNEVAAFYDCELSKVPQVIIPSRSSFSTHVFHQYTIRVPSEKRNQLKHFLQEVGIPTMIYYPIPLHLQAAYRTDGFPAGSFPITEQLSETVLSLPIHTEMTEKELSYICGQIKTFFTNE